MVIVMIIVIMVTIKWYDQDDLNDYEDGNYENV